MPNYRIVLKDPKRQAAQAQDGFIKPVSTYAADKQQARKKAKDFCQANCSVEIYETREVLIETVDLCEQCGGTCKTCMKCGSAKAACECAGGFDPVVCLGCEGKGTITVSK